MANLLFEIGCEELPAGYIDPALSFMVEFLKAQLSAARIGHGDLTAYGTPRRLVLVGLELDKAQSEEEEEFIGPAVAVAFDVHGALTKAGAGFLQARGISEEHAYRKETKRGLVLAAKQKKKWWQDH